MERKIVENVSQKWSIFGKTSQNRRFEGKNVFFEKKVWRKFLTSKPPTRKNNGPTTKNKNFFKIAEVLSYKYIPLRPPRDGWLFRNNSRHPHISFHQNLPPEALFKFPLFKSGAEARSRSDSPTATYFEHHNT